MALKSLKSPAARSSFRRPLNCKMLRSSLRRRPACFAMVPPELLRSTFWAPLKSLKSPAARSNFRRPQNPPQQLAKASRLLCHGTSLGPASCFYWASKLLRGTFWAASKAPQQLSKAFEPHKTFRSSLRRRPACFAIVPP